MKILSNYYYEWPLMAVVGNSHEPQWVEDVLARVRELDHEALTMLTGFMVIVAWDETERN